MSDAPVSALERGAWQVGRAVVGVDEVGRGAWAGPVTVAAVMLDPDRLPVGVRDSKQLSPSARDRADSAVRAHGLVGIGRAENDEVDAVGLAAALRAAARRAVEALLALPEVDTGALIIVDGDRDLIGRADLEVVTLVRGDSAALSVAAASVVAKVHRDHEMIALSSAYPAYAFERNKGYASPAHVAALETHGPCALHRCTWAPLARLAQPRLSED
jgi:ribonuclease HII